MQPDLPFLSQHSNVEFATIYPQSTFSSLIYSLCIRPLCGTYTSFACQVLQLLVPVAPRGNVQVLATKTRSFGPRRFNACVPKL